MALIALTTALSFLEAAPKVLAALPEFKELWDRIVDSFDGEAEQADLKAAYDQAISDAGTQHASFQDIVRRHGGEPSTG